VIAEVSPDGTVRILDNLQQAVPVGRDTYTRGEITRQTIEECVRVITSYRHIMAEYQITHEDQIRAVATAAVREAVNRVNFLDRIFIATGIAVEPLDETDITRLTYLGLYPQLSRDRTLHSSNVLVAAMEGGSTDVTFIEKGTVTFSRNYRLGSMKLQKMLETCQAPASQERDLMEDHIEQTVDVIVNNLPTRRSVRLLALGSEARFAAAQLKGRWDGESITRLQLQPYGRLTGKVLEQSVDKTTRAYHLPYTEAETLAPTLYFYERLARSLQQRSILVSGVSMRSGVVQEIARRDLWVATFGDQIIGPAREIARKYHVNETHADHVAVLCHAIFAAMEPVHKLGPWHELLLTVAALLHDIGLYVSERSHHKHSMYLINNSELFGLSRRDRLLVSLLARYHRRAGPKPTHEGFSLLNRNDRVVVAKLASILRVADALDRSYSQRIRDISCVREPGRFVIEVPNCTDLSLERLALRSKDSMFREVFGMEVILRSVNK
jgi:exopolyphosphatase / guanosine-5'-triphosphate,3'-diphosphate pyrophosphatase